MIYIPRDTSASAWRDPVFLAILALGAFLIFYHLGQRPLWQDEAETANLARNVLRTGLPKTFDGVNIISQEERREFGPDMIWRWSPWLQVYMSAAGQRISPGSTFWARFFFAVAGLGCIAAVYLLIRSRFDDKAWARASAALLALSVPFLLYARQGRYYSTGGLIVLLVLWAFLGDWKRKLGLTAVIGLALGLLFHANYLLLFSLAPPLLVAALLLYRQSVTWRRVGLVIVFACLLVVPGIFLYQLGRQSTLFNVMVIPENVEMYFSDWVMFMIPLPVLIVLAWRWRGFFMGRGGPQDPKERFCLFLTLVMVGSLLILAIFPQRFHRYIVHFYPLCAILLGWAGISLWRFSRPSGALFLMLTGLTNWLLIVPMDALGIANRPWENDFRMLTSVNIPLKLFLTESICGYPDVNIGLVDFFLTHAKPGQTILAEYDDMPLQFYTPFRVIGGLQGPIDPNEKPDWVLMRRDVRANRDGVLFAPREFITSRLDLDRDYERIELPFPDETFGNRPGPQFHHFLPVGPPQSPMVVHRLKEAARAR